MTFNFLKTIDDRTTVSVGGRLVTVAYARPADVKQAVELLFKVQVDSVQIVNQKGKPKRYGRFEGRRDHTKKAYVNLKPGQEINFEAEAN